MPESRVEFFSDPPITSKDQDILNRTRFAHRLADGILSWDRAASSLVVAIFGDWGSGKTSVKELVLEYLRRSSTPPEVIEFNPWTYKSEEQLRQAFLDQLFLAICKVDTTANKEIAQGFHAWSGIATGIGGALKVSAGVLAFGNETAAKFVGQIADIVKTVGETGKLSLEAINEVQKVPSLESVKSQLSDKFKALEQPILVCIDDVDRLSAQEIRLLFQLIKANSDFPNLAFLVLCQREVVEHSLAELLPSKLDQSFAVGRAFLNKIVHISVTIPPLKAVKILELLKARIWPLFEKVKFSEQKQFQEAAQLIAPFFTTMRQIIRFQSALSFQFGLYIHDAKAYVHPIDLMLMEALRIFVPEVHEAVILNGSKLISGEAPSTERNNCAAKARAEHKDICNGILMLLFPASGGKPITPYDAEKQRRICHASTWEAYTEFAASAVVQMDEPVNVKG